MKDSIAYGLNGLAIACGILVIYLGLINEPVSYVNVIVTLGGLLLTIMGIMFITTSIKLNKKLKREE